MAADEIIAAARECIGTPFRHQGRLLGIGLDCAGVAVHVARSVGCEVVDVAGYGRTPADGQLESMLDAQPFLARVASLHERQPGDVLLMKFGRDPQHLAILAADDTETIIHAWEAVARCCEHLLDDVWLRRILRVYRFVGVEP